MALLGRGLGYVSSLDPVSVQLLMKGGGCQWNEVSGTCQVQHAFETKVVLSMRRRTRAAKAMQGATLQLSSRRAPLLSLPFPSFPLPFFSLGGQLYCFYC